MIEDTHLDEDAREALASDRAVVREVKAADGGVFKRVVEPYQSDIGGVKVTYMPAASSLPGGEPAINSTVQSLASRITPLGVWTLEADGSRFDWDQYFSEISGLGASGCSLSDSGFETHILEEDRAAFAHSLQAVTEEGEAQDIELRYCGPGLPQRWLRLLCEKLQFGGREVVVGVLADVTERKDGKERSDFMMRELDHRVKNLLAIILSIAEITARSDTDIETYTSNFRSRLESMVRTHNLLSQTRWGGADLRLLVEEEVFSLVPKAEVTIDGVSLEITPAATQSLAMFFHELTANALKHGALATGSGRIAITWEIDRSAGDRLHLTWAESGGDDVAEPAREGFGGRVINRIVKRQLEADVTTEWHRTGMKLTATIPLRNITASSNIDENSG